MKYYISDLHFGHKNIFSFSERPYKDMDTMVKSMVQSCNNVVKKSDDVYILGDMFYGNKLDYYKILISLKGHKHLIKGNHDQWIDNNPELEDLFDSVQEYKVIEDLGRKVVLFHYPIAEWNHKHYRAIHLYGHVHDRDTEITRIMYNQDNCYNGCTDVIGYVPRTLDSLVKLELNVHKHMENISQFTEETVYRLLMVYRKEYWKGFNEGLDLAYKELQNG